jgi:hypothetical protein
VFIRHGRYSSIFSFVGSPGDDPGFYPYQGHVLTSYTKSPYIVAMMRFELMTAFKPSAYEAPKIDHSLHIAIFELVVGLEPTYSFRKLTVLQTAG